MLPGTFDPGQTPESFWEALATIASIGTHVLTLARMQAAAIG
jgi:hypothetical protein